MAHHDVFVLIEDDAQLRRIVAVLMRQQFPDQRIEAFESGRQAVAFCQREKVALLLTDIGLPDMDGLEVIRLLRAQDRIGHVIVMTGTPNDNLPRELWDLGVAGFLDKTSLHEHVVPAMERVLAGGMYFSAQVTPTRLSVGADAAAHPGLVEPGLSGRERDVARLVATGLLTKEIAAQLHLSPRTVEKHRARVMHKVGVRSVPQLVYWCLRQGLV